MVTNRKVYINLKQQTLNRYTHLYTLMFKENDIIEINKEFDSGVIVNKSSLDFAIKSTEITKDWVTQASYLVRAIALDHVFEEGNKRTALAVLLTYFEANKKAYDIYRVEKVIIDIITKNITSIENIRRMIKNAVR